MRVLIVSFYFPPAGGGGVQRVLKLCRHLPELGIDVDVLAPDDPKWSAVDPGLAADIPATTTVHRARYRGPSHAQTPAARLAAAHGISGLGVRAALLGRRVLLPDPEVAWLPDAVRAGTRIVRERGIDVVLSTSPPNSVHVIGAAIARRTGVPLVTDFRDSWLANPHRRYERRSVRAKRAVEGRIARRALRGVAAVSAVTPAIAEEAAELAPAGTTVRVVANGCDFDEFDGLAYTRGERMRIVHAGSFFGQRTPRPFLSAFAALLASRPELRGRVQAAFLGELRPADREWALALGLGDALALEGFQPHARALAAMRAADALLLLVPRAGGRGLSVVSGKVYEYLAAERPIVALVPPEGDAASLLRDTGSAWIADPDDEGAIGAALAEAVRAWEDDRLGERRLPAEWRERLDRRTRAAELAELLRAVVSSGS
ncbi:MAG TPA: glycosyltransferase [Gaiellales bacterium]|jgi:glycosyltransferase involved in cell wall biosynthesis